MGRRAVERIAGNALYETLPEILCSRLTLVEAHRAIRRAEVGDEISEANAEEIWPPERDLAPGDRPRRASATRASKELDPRSVTG